MGAWSSDWAQKMSIKNMMQEEAEDLQEMQVTVFRQLIGYISFTKKN